MSDTIIVDADSEYESSVKTAEKNAENTIETEPEETEFEETESIQDEIEIETESKTPSIETQGSEIAQLKATIKELQDQILQMSAMSAQTRESVDPVKSKTVNTEEEQLTKDQLAQIIAENGDKPKVLLEVIDYIADQKAKAAKYQAFEEVSQSNWEREIAGHANQILAEDRDGYLAANPTVKNKIGQVMRNMRWEKHPAGALAAYALIRLGEGLVKKEETLSAEKEKKLSSGKMDKTRLSTAIKEGGKNKKLTKEHLEMAKRLGVKDVNLMARFIP